MMECKYLDICSEWAFVRCKSDFDLHEDQFVYDAADCRIFYTFETWSDYSQLWTYAVNAANDPKLCVAGSTGFSSTLASSQAPTPPPTSKSPAYNASAVLGTSNQFTNMFGDQELDEFHPQESGVQRAVSQTCNNHGNGCPVGRCSSKTIQGPGSYNGRTITFRSGVCPANAAASTGLNGLVTKNNEPAEIHGDGGKKKKASGAGSVVDAIKRPFTNP